MSHAIMCHTFRLRKSLFFHCISGLNGYDGASKVLRRFSDQDLTLADAVDLHLMQERKLKVCWSTDFHLALTGVPLVINFAH